MSRKRVTGKSRQDLVVSELGEPNRIEGDEWLYKCWFCPKSDPDPSSHLGVNVKKGLYHCHRCKSGGHLSEIVDKRLSSVPLDEEHGKDRQQGESIGDRNETEEKARVKQALRRVSPQTDTGVAGEVKDYVTSRISTDLWPEVLVSETEDLMGRAVFPVRDEDGEIKQYSARTIWYWQEPKTLYGRADEWASIRDLVWVHRTAADPEKEIVITEGVFDALQDFGGYRFGAALLGSRMTKGEARRIGRLASSAVVFLDRDISRLDAVEAGIKLRKTAAIPTSVVIWPESLTGADDPAELPSSTRKRLVDDAVVVSTEDMSWVRKIL